MRLACVIPGGWLMMASLVVSSLLVTLTLATKPNGWVQPPREPDPHPPNYEYGYAVAAAASLQQQQPEHHQQQQQLNGVNLTDISGGNSVVRLDGGGGGGGGGDGDGQGHQERRSGDNTEGNYYVKFAGGQAQSSVQYVADDWGYHPVVRYSTQDAHSRVSSHFALGESAVERLRSDQHFSLQPVAQALGPLVPEAPALQYAVPAPAATHSNPLPSPLHHSPEQLQIIGVIPREFPGPLANQLNSQSRQSTIIYPVAQPLIAQLPPPNQTSVRNTNIFRPSETTGRTPTPTSTSTPTLVDKTHSLINGFDVIDINHSAESVAQNTLFQAADEQDEYNAASQGQQEASAAKTVSDNRQTDGFGAPIVVGDDEERRGQPAYATSENPEVSIKPAAPRFPTEIPKMVKQINLQIFDNDNDDNIRIPEAASRVFLKNFHAPKGTTEAVPSSTPASHPSTAGPAVSTISQTVFHVNKDVSIKNALLDEESPRANSLEPSADLVANNQVGYSTTERPVEEVEIQQQILIPYPAESHHEKQASLATDHLTFEGIINEHIETTQNNAEQTEPEQISYAVEPKVTEKIVEKPVPYPYPVEVPVEKIIEKPVPVPVERIVEKYVQQPIPLQVEQIAEKYAARPVEPSSAPYSIPYAVQLPIQVPYPLANSIESPFPQQYHHHQPQVPSFQPLPPPLLHLPPQLHQPKPYFIKKYPDHDQYQPYPLHALPPPPSAHKYFKQAPTFLPHVHSLPSHLQQYYAKTAAPQQQQQQPPPHFSPISTHLQPIRSYPAFRSLQQPRPVYGVPSVLLDNYRQLPSYAGSFGYAGNGVYRDDYSGPPPPLLQQLPLPAHNTVWSYPVAANQQHRSVQLPADGELQAAGSVRSSATVQSPNSLVSGAVAADHQQQQQQQQQQRRTLNFGKNMRWEQGFRPPMVPSVQTDEHGMPLNLLGTEQQ